MNKAITVFFTVFFLAFSPLSIAEIIIQHDNKETKIIQEEIRSNDNENVAPANADDSDHSSQSASKDSSQSSNSNNEYYRRKFFIQGSLGLSASTNGSKNARFTVGKLSAGMDVSRKYAVEIGAATFMNVLELDKDVKYLSFVLKSPLTPKATLLSKVGVTSWSKTEYFLLSPEIRTSGNSGMIGLDLDYKVYDYVSLTVGFDYYGGITETPVYLGLKVTF